MLARRITGFQATLLVVGAMVGSGILATPAIVASSLDSSALILALWAAGGLYALAGALSQAELAALYPEAGGDYVFLRESFGKPVAFLSGWVSLTIGFAGAIAVLARSCSQYLGRAGLQLPLASMQEEVVAIAVIAALTAINLVGVRGGSWTQSILTLLKVLLLVVLALAALLASGPPRPIEAASAPVWAALLPVVFTYSGWNDSIYLGSEIKNPGRNLPLSLIAGTVGVTALYLFFNYVYLRTTGGAGSNEDLAAAAGMAQAALGGSASAVVSGLASLLLFGTIAALVISGPRIAYAMGLDGVLPRALGAVSARGVPANALLFQAGVAALFVVMGTLEQIVNWVGLALVVFSGLATACLFVERGRGRTPKAYSTPLYPLPPLIYVATSAGVALWVSIADPIQTAKGMLFIVAGLPVYYISRRR